MSSTTSTTTLVPLLVLAVVVAASLHLETVHSLNIFGGKPLPVDKVDEYLVQKEPTDELQANIEAARNCLAIYEDSIRDKSCVIPLKLLISLEDLDEGEHFCSEQNGLLLENFKNYLVKHIRDPFGRIHRRIVRIVLDLLKRNTLECGPTANKSIQWGPTVIELQHELPGDYYTLVFSLSEALTRLNSVLKTKVTTMEWDDNMEAAEVLFGELRHHKIHDTFAEVLRQFLALRAITPKNLCSQESGQLASDYMQTMSNWARNPYTGPKASFKLISLVKLFFRERAAKCMKEYADDLEKKVASFEATVGPALKAYAARAIEANNCKFTEKFGDQLVEDLNCAIRKSRVELNSADDIGAIYDTLSDIRESQHHQAANVVAESRIGKDFDELLVRPCHWLVQNRKAATLVKSFETSRSVHLTDQFFRVAQHYDNQLTDSFHDLIEWTTIFSVCKRLLEADRDLVVQQLTGLVGQS